jgi:hypothetical protein
MIRCFTTLLFGMLLGAGAIWFFIEGKTWLKPSGASSAEALEGREIPADHLTAEEVMEEFERTGGIVRRRAAAHPGMVGEDSAQIAVAIEKRIAADHRLKPLEIGVQVEPHRVLLSGRVDSPEDISQAMSIALELAGKREVVSLLHIRLLRDDPDK